MDGIGQVGRCFYFAYGSNLDRARIESRIGPVHTKSRAKLEGYAFKYNKKSKDGTAKANIARSMKSEDQVWGVIYEIDGGQLNSLEKIEEGYERIEISTLMDNGATIFAKSFSSKNITNAPPSKGYADIVINGARAQGLPEDYIERCLVSKRYAAQPTKYNPAVNRR